MESQIRSEGSRHSSGGKRNSASKKQETALQGDVPLEQVCFSAEGRREAAVLTDMSCLPALLVSPVREIAQEFRGALREFIKTCRVGETNFGFNTRGAEAVPLTPLLSNLDKWGNQLEAAIEAQRGLPPELGAVRLLAIELQANLEMFSLLLRCASKDGELANSQMAQVMERAINLKAEMGVLVTRTDKMAGRIRIQ